MVNQIEYMNGFRMKPPHDEKELLAPWEIDHLTVECGERK